MKDTLPEETAVLEEDDDDALEEEDVGFLNGSQRVSTNDYEDSSSSSGGCKRWMSQNRDLAVVFVVCVLASVVGLVAYRQSTTTTTSNQYANGYVFTTAERLRIDMAAASIDIMKQDNSQATQENPWMDIKGFADLVEVALDELGLVGVLDGFFEAPEYAEAFAIAAQEQGMSQITATAGTSGPHHVGVVSFHGLPTDRVFHYAPDRRCTGCFWWLRHYIGVVAADKLVREGSLRLQAGSKKRLTTAGAVYEELRHVQRTLGRPESLTIDFGHGFVWSYVLATQPNLTEYPDDLAREFCGDSYAKADYVPGLERDIGYECMHGFGHAVWYALASRRFGPKSVRYQPFPKTGLFLGKELACEGMRICREAPGGTRDRTSPAFGCFDGFVHTTTLVGDDVLTDQNCGSFLNRLCAD